MSIILSDLPVNEWLIIMGTHEKTLASKPILNPALGVYR